MHLEDDDTLTIGFHKYSDCNAGLQVFYAKILDTVINAPLLFVSSTAALGLLPQPPTSPRSCRSDRPTPSPHRVAVRSTSPHQAITA